MAASADNITCQGSDARLLPRKKQHSLSKNLIPEAWIDPIQFA